jgi:DNA-directed RNA polymerase subunit alpha
MSTRVGRETNLDKLILDVWTDGTVKPLEAVERAAKILVSYFSQVYQPMAVSGETKTPISSMVSDDVSRMLVEELDLPTRLENALKNGNIETVGQLLSTPRKELLKIKNLGGKSLEMVEERLREKGVALSI